MQCSSVLVILFFVFALGLSPSCEVLLWSSGEPSPQLHQSIPHPGLTSIHSFTISSGISQWNSFNRNRNSNVQSRIMFVFFSLVAYLMLAGVNGSSFYSWRSDSSLFSVVLRGPKAYSFLSFMVPSFNATKVLLAATEETGSTIYEFTFVSNQSDFIPRYLACQNNNRSSNHIDNFLCFLLLPHIKFW